MTSFDFFSDNFTYVLTVPNSTNIPENDQEGGIERDVIRLYNISEIPVHQNDEVIEPGPPSPDVTEGANENDTQGIITHLIYLYDIQ